MREQERKHEDFMRESSISAASRSVCHLIKSFGHEPLRLPATSSWDQDFIRTRNEGLTCRKLSRKVFSILKHIKDQDVWLEEALKKTCLYVSVCFFDESLWLISFFSCLSRPVFFLLLLHILTPEVPGGPPQE